MAVRSSRTGESCVECGHPIVTRAIVEKDFDHKDYVVREDPTSCYVTSCSEHRRRCAS